MLKVDARDKEKLIDPLFRSSPGFWILIAGLSLVVSWGIYMYARQVTLGLGVTGMNRPVFWGTYMVNFIFFIGISHAGTLISAILRVTNAEWRRPITRVAEAITAFALIVGTLQIIIDMGRPDRLMSVLLHGRLQSPILWDVVSVTAYFLGSVTYLYLPIIPDAALLRDNYPEGKPLWRKKLYKMLALGWRGNKTQWVRLEKAIAVMAILIIPIAISVHTIISWILAMTVQPGWHSTIFGPYFVVGAIFSGIGALFVVMTLVRKQMGLEDYITEKQYFNLGLIFITMSAVWMYFTYAEHLTLAAGQEVYEFPILASKLWGEFSFGFWSMIVLMILAFWVLVVPLLLPREQKTFVLFRPLPSGLAGIGSIGLAVLLKYGVFLKYEWLAWVHIGVLTVVALMGLAYWLRTRLIQASVLASVAVLIAMWLERWNIIIPTVTHPYLIPFATYQPSLTELALTLASLALFVLMFLLFFKLFPVISIWEVAEGRLVDQAHDAIEIPLPEVSN